MNEPLRVPWDGAPPDGELADFVAQVQARCQQDALCRAYQILGDWDAAQDAVQDALTAFWEAAQRGALRGDVIPWFLAVTRNTAVSHLRATKRVRMLFAGESSQIQEAIAQSSEPHPLAEAARTELAKLPGKQRKAMELVYLEGLSHHEAAGRLNCSRSALRAHLTLARAKLKESLTKKKIQVACCKILFGNVLRPGVF